MQNRIPALYHYEKFNAEYLTTTLRDETIHCSNPTNLNDPWDCKPAFDPHSLDDPDVLQREIAWREEAATVEGIFRSEKMRHPLERCSN